MNGEKSGADEPPPFLGTWRNVYLLVASYLACMIILLAVLAHWATTL